MYIDSKGTIEGISILKIRDLLRRSGLLGMKYVAYRLKVKKSKAESILKALEKDGYIKKGEDNYWQPTLKGRTLALASAAKPITRATADKKLVEFMDRIHEVNTSMRFLYRVSKVVIFGSYLNGGDKINDIDIAVRLVHKVADKDKRMEVEKKHNNKAEKRGKQFRNFMAWLWWPWEEVMFFLKSRSRSISLHTYDIDKEIIEKGNYRILYDEDEPEKIAGCFKKYTHGKKISIEKDIKKVWEIVANEVAKKDVEKDPAMGIIGLGGSGKGNLSYKHDKYLVKHTVSRKR